MKNPDYIVLNKTPTVEAFIALREAVGWGVTCPRLAKLSLENSLYFVCVHFERQLIGMGRVIGDGGLNFYIQDLVVAPEHQGLGVGSLLMNNIEGYLKNNAADGATIGLLAAKGKEGFYSRYEYLLRPNNELGNGMCRFV